MTRGFFWVAKKNKGIFLSSVLFISSNQQHKHNLLLVWDFLGMLKMVIGIYFG